MARLFTTVTEYLTPETLGRNYLFWVTVQRFWSVVAGMTVEQISPHHNSQEAEKVRIKEEPMVR